MFWETAIQVVLALIVLVISVIGNGTVGALLIRFKKLRTIPNIVVANMALVDVLNSLINMPVLIFFFMLKIYSPLTPKTNTLVGGFLFLLFQELNLYSMVLMATDRYGAIVHGMKYNLWKTRKKAYLAVGLVWIFSFVCTVAICVPFLGIDIQNGTTTDYRRVQFQTSIGKSWLIQLPLIIAVIGIFSALTWRGMSQARKQVPGFEDGMSSRLRQTRRENDMKVAITMLMTFMVYFLSYVPSITFPILKRKGIAVDHVWLKFFVLLGPYIASACNPIIYALRARRFRHAIKQFWKGPCGDSPFQEVKEPRPVPKPQQKTPSVRFIGKPNEVDIQGPTVLPGSNKRESDGMTNSDANEEIRPVLKPQQKTPSVRFTGKPNEVDIQGPTALPSSNSNPNEGNASPVLKPQQKTHRLLIGC